MDVWLGGAMFISHERAVANKQRVVRPGLWRLGMSGCSLCIRLGTYVVVARALGTQNLGVLLFTQWIASLLLPFIGTGMTPLASSRVVELHYYETAHTIAGIFHLRWRQQCHRILLYCIIYVPLTFFLSLLLKGAIPFFLLLVAGLAATPLLLSGVASTTLQGLRHYNLLATLRFFSTLLNFCLVFRVTQEHSQVVGMLLLVPAFTGILTLTIALLCIAKLLPFHDALEPGPLLRERIEQSQRPSLLFFVLDTVSWRELLFLVLILMYGQTFTALSYYAFSLLLCTHLIEVAPTLFITCILPVTSRLLRKHIYTDTYNAFVKTSYAIALLAGVMCTCISICAPLIISICFGNSYLPMVTPFRILLSGVVAGSVATVSLTYLAQHKRRREQTWLGIGTAVLHIGLALPCIMLWGIVGAALTSTIAHVIMTIGIILICRKFLLHSYSKGKNKE